MLVTLSRSWGCSLLLGVVGLIVGGTAKNAAHWRGAPAFLWLVLVIGLGAGLGAGAGSVRPFHPWLTLLLTVSLPVPFALVIVGLIVRASRGFDVSLLVVVGSLLLSGLAAAAAAAGVWSLRQRLHGEPWRPDFSRSVQA